MTAATAKRRALLTGGTGLIGRALVDRLLARGDAVAVVTRRADKLRDSDPWNRVELLEGDPTRPGEWQRALAGRDAVFNLAGHPVFPASPWGLFTGRWSKKTKRLIRESRVQATERVVEAIDRANAPVGALVQASAIGYYGSVVGGPADESAPPGDDFLADVCKDWEAAARPAAAATRLAIVRVGVVLAREGGVLALLVPMFKWMTWSALPVGNPKSRWLPADGKQWIGWIHLDDVADLFLRAADDPGAFGPINAVAPRPATNADLTRELARVLHRPRLPFGPPEAMLRVVIGQAAEVITSGQRVVPAAAERLGFAFRHPELGPAVDQLLGKGSTPPADRPRAT